jgi:excisionase family DNA binding protein
MITRADSNNQALPSDLESRDPEERYVTPSYLARYWNVHINTIYRDIQKGALRAYRLPGGPLRIRWSDAQAYGRPVE